MEDLEARRDRILAEAADCALIANLATDPRKRETFRRHAERLRQLSAEIDAEIERRNAEDA